MALTPTALWIVGLPGSGKSTVAALVAHALREIGVRAEILSMDARRRDWFPHPRYDAAEREAAYAKLLDEAVRMVEAGVFPILDAAAHRLAWRRAGRARIPGLVEAHLKVPLAVAAAREAARPQGAVMAGLYAKALARKERGEIFPGLGEVVGVDVPFEIDPEAEITLDAGETPPHHLAQAILTALNLPTSPAANDQSPS